MVFKRRILSTLPEFKINREVIATAVYPLGKEEIKLRERDIQAFDSFSLSGLLALRFHVGFWVSTGGWAVGEDWPN